MMIVIMIKMLTKLGQLFKDLIQSLIAVRNNKGVLCGIVVIKIGDRLYGDIGFTSARRTHHHCETMIHARVNRFNYQKNT